MTAGTRPDWWRPSVVGGWPAGPGQKVREVFEALYEQAPWWWDTP